MPGKVGRRSLSGEGASPQLRLRVSAQTRDGLSRAAKDSDRTVSDLVRPLVEHMARKSRPEELVQVELHRKVLGKLLQDREHVLGIARRNLERARVRGKSSTAAAWQDQWESLLNGPIRELVPVMVSLDERSIDLRQVSPFAGTLSDDERLEAIAVGRALAAHGYP